MNTPATPKSHDPVSGPGARLAQARQDSRLGQEEVAHRLHLSVYQIQALEQDDYRALPGATYVRGYLKSYAMLLGIDPAPVLDAHSRMTARQVPPPDFSNIAPQREITSRHHQVRIVTYLVVVVVIGLAIAWWQGRNAPTDSPLATSQNVEPVPTETTGEPAELVPGMQPDTQAGARDASSTPAAQPAISPPPIETMKPPATPAVQQSAPAAAAPATPAAAMSPPVQQPVSPPAAPPPLPTGPRGKVVVHAEQDTWVDVRDSRQVKLIYETISAGRTVTLEGVAPISIFLGNAAGTRVEYNGRAVDVARHQRGMVARFVVGEEDTTPATQH